MFIDSLRKVQKEITDLEKLYNRETGTVKIMIVTKNQNSESLTALLNVGHNYFGENRVDELKKKKEENPSGIFAFIAPIQTRKLKSIMEYSDEIHSISREKEIMLLSNAHWDGDYYIQINIDMEESKSGIEKEKVGDLFDFANNHYKLPKGIMCIRKNEKINIENSSFSSMKYINNDLINTYSQYSGSLSMGMSNDYEEAIRYGATVIRLGTKIFTE
tara:strand:- start:95 stop:745 length:651 start_codon:yes stop_codon:yes gene_type:complete